MTQDEERVTIVTRARQGGKTLARTLFDLHRQRAANNISKRPDLMLAIKIDAAVAEIESMMAVHDW
jgi:hypothetical protein